jgi:hypothetical protein
LGWSYLSLNNGWHKSFFSLPDGHLKVQNAFFLYFFREIAGLVELGERQGEGSCCTPPQILADQLPNPILGGADYAPHIYIRPSIFRPSAGSD